MFAHNIVIESVERKIIISSQGETIAESSRALKLHEPPLLPVYYVPRDDVDMAKLTPSRHHTTCPFKGEATYYHLDINGEHFENAAWSYESPKDNVADIKGFIAFYDSMVDVTLP